MAKKTRIIIGAVLGGAAILAVAVGCMFGLSKDNPDTDSNGASQSGNVSSGDAAAPSVFKTVADNVEGDLQTKFNGAEDIPSMAALHGMAMPAENGWYYDNGAVCYRDNATGESVFLCARPECTHDTEYCVAANSRYKGKPLTYYNGYLYGISGDTTKVNDDDNTDTTFWEPGYGDILLMQYAPDGTALDKLVSLQDALPDAPDSHVFASGAEIIGHKGALWISIRLQRDYYIQSERITFGGYALFHYDLTKDKLTMVCYFPLTEGANPSMPSCLQGIGEYVYFAKTNQDWLDPLNGDDVYRVNIRTGEIEAVLANGHCGSYSTNGKKLVYPKLLSTDNDGARIRAMLLDLETGEDKAFLPTDVNIRAIQCTQEYVIIVPADTPECLQLYDFEGNLLQTLPALDTAPLNPHANNLLKTAVNGNTIYAMIYNVLGDYRIYAADLQAAASGNAQWQLAMEPS